MEDKNKGEQGTEGAAPEVKEEVKEFDAGAFMTDDAPVVVAEEKKEVSGEGGEGKPAGGEGKENTEEAFSWDNETEAETEEEKVARLAEEKIKADELVAAGGGEEELTQEQKDAAAEKLAEEQKLAAEKGSITDNESFKTLNEQLGTKFETVDEMKEHLIELEKKNQELSQNQNVGLDNERIQNLKKLKGNSDEDLVRMDLERQGFKDEALKKAVDKIIDNDMIDIEAQKIKNTIDNAINSEQNNIAKSNDQAEAKQQQDYEDNVKVLAEHINGTETMFGFNMAKDPESLKTVRAEHQEYITSGNFLEDVTKDAESISEAAWLWKHKDTLMKAIGKREHTKGREEILNDIGVPEIPSSKRIKAPEGDGGFNIGKFTAGD